MTIFERSNDDDAQEEEESLLSDGAFVQPSAPVNSLPVRKAIVKDMQKMDGQNE